MDERLHPPFPNKGDLRISKNYLSKNITAIYAKEYIFLLLKCVWLQVKKITSERLSEK